MMDRQDELDILILGAGKQRGISIFTFTPLKSNL